MLLRFFGAFAAFALVCSAVRAEECPLPEGADAKLTQVDASARLKFLQESLNADAHRTSLWRWGWVAGYGVVAVGELTLAQFVPAPKEGEKSQKPGLYVGGIMAGLATLPLLVLPPKVAHDGPAFDAKVKAAAPGDTCALVKEGELVLAADAENQREAVGPVMHGVNVIYNLIGVAILGFGFHDWKSAAISGGLGVLVGETMIFTQPTHLTDNLKQYKAGAFAAPVEPPKLSFSASPGGFLISGTF